MPFVKLDAGILTSTLWEEPDATKLVFLTALLLAGPYEVTEPMEQLEIRSLKTTNFVIPPDWYGFVAAAGIGIIRQARVEPELGLTALEKLGAPDPASRSSAFEGRRLVRVEGGFVVLNFFKYRDRDYSAAERMRKLRARKAEGKSASDVLVCSPNERNVRANVTHSRGQSAEAEAETEKIKTSSPELLLSSYHTPEPTPPGVDPTPKATASSSVIPDWIPAESWAGFVEVRKRLRAPMTERAGRLLIAQLAKLRDQGEDVGAVLDQSTANSWKGFFPVKRDRPTPAGEPAPIIFKKATKQTPDGQQCTSPLLRTYWDFVSNPEDPDLPIEKVFEMRKMTITPEMAREIAEVRAARKALAV